YSVRVGFLRFLGLSRRRRGRAEILVRRPLPDLARHRLPRSEILLPSLFKPLRQGSGGNGEFDLGADQPGQSARKYPADAPARRPDIEKSREPPGRGSLAAAAVNVRPRACRWRNARRSVA